MANDPYEGLDPTFSASLRAMIQESGGKIGINNGYRSIAQQKVLYDNVMAKYGRNDIPGKQVARPGSSQHNYGLAVDLTGDLKLAAQLGAKYGLHFPVKGEAWHVEPLWGRKNGAHKDSGIQHVDGATGNPDDPEDDLPDEARNAMDVFAQMVNGTMVSPDAVMESPEVVMGETAAVTGGEDQELELPEMQAAQEQPDASGGVPVDGAPVNGDQLSGLMAAIGGKESNNNYQARNGDSGAFGKYQIMPANWPSWAREAGLPANAPQTPENQERVARHKLGQYLSKYGVEGAAQAWYGGEGSVGKTNRSGGFGGKYPTVGQYGQDIAKRVG